MEGILEWVKQIVCYLVFVTVLTGLFPKKNYEKYFRLFAGLILILLVIQPVTGALDLDEKLLKAFEAIEYEGTAREFRQQASEMEAERFRRITEGYGEVVEEDIETMARAQGAWDAKAQVTIEEDSRKENYGKITGIRLTVWEKEQSREAAASVDPVKVGVEDVIIGSPETEPPFTETEKGKELKSRIAEDYGLEESCVEIQWED